MDYTHHEVGADLVGDTVNAITTPSKHRRIYRFDRLCSVRYRGTQPGRQSDRVPLG
jgi:hypothetical protein